ncbi:MAG TPA: HD domain-containing protein [Crocinitomicaceae bacterium]|nr:HD domain-containing protein [Crocinitomicaceae bacterium]
MRPNLKRNNKNKIVNDPVYGFISIPNELIYDLIQHPYFQRLRRIEQLGMSDLVYPGAKHTRFHHVLGATHLMNLAIQTLRRKGVEITEKEEEAVLAAILLHDIGHGPFSHALEYDIVNKVSHESISTFFIEKLNKEMHGRLDLTLQIFQNNHSKPFLYQLVSSQLDMDRMDYLNRDSFYTGVTEGQIGADRIISMLNVVDGNLVIEEKGIYSVEKFLVARRFMYWQVYLHKTVVAAEQMLIHILRRAKALSRQGKTIFASPSLQFFLQNDIQEHDFIKDDTVLNHFANLDDSDIISAIKVWQNHEDKVLSILSKRLIDRKLFKIEVDKREYTAERINFEKNAVQQALQLTTEEAEYFVYAEKLTNSAYNLKKQNINILLKSGEVVDASIASDNYNLEALSTTVTKYFLCYAI